MPSTISRGDGKPGPLSSLFDDLEAGVTSGIRAGVQKCAKMTQTEVVKRCPVATGNLKSCFASSEALAKDEEGHWVYGLITPDLAARGHYWRFVEFGTKGKHKSRPAHPFFRPGVLWARRQWIAIMMVELSIALAIAGVGKDQGGNRFMNEDTETAQAGAAIGVALHLDRKARGLDISQNRSKQ